MRRLRIVAAAAVLALTAVSCHLPESGSGTLQGRVTDASGLGLASVAVIYGDSAVYTAETGAYIYDGLPDGLQGVRFTMDGYYGVMRQVNIPDGGSVTCDVSMDIFTSGWAVGAGDSGYGTILRTLDAGRTWVRQGSTEMVPAVNLKDVCAVNDSVCWVTGDADTLRNTSVLLRTDDGGATWINQAGSLPMMNIRAVMSRDGVNAWAAADSCMILRTTDAGDSWEICRTSSDVVRYTAVTTPDGVNIWCCGTDEAGGVVVEYSPDGGTTWNVYPVSAAYSGQVPEDILAVDSGTVYLTGSSSMGVLRSVDWGRTWTAVTPIPGDLSAMDACGEETVWACGGRGMLYRTGDGFYTRRDVTLAADSYPGGTVTSVAFLRDAKRGAASVKSVSGATGTILYTTDGGEIWNSSSVPFSFSIESLDFVGGNN